MTQFSTLSIAAALAVAVAATLLAAKLIRPRLRRLNKHLKCLGTPGFVPPPPTVLSERWQFRLTRFFTWVFAGKLETSGLEHLDEIPPGASYQITPNHSHFADIFVLPVIMKGRRARYMADPAVMKGCGGLFGLIAAKMGAFAASLKGASAVLQSGDPMVIFPEGFTYLDGNMGRCRNGAVHLCRESAEKLGQPSYLVPAYLKYGRYPGAWIKKLPIRWQYLVLCFGLPYYRRGVKVVVGKPIANNDLPVANDRTASEFLRQEILNLKP